MYKRIILLLVSLLIIISGLNTTSALDNYCGNVYYKYNYKEDISVDEVNTCRKELVKNYKTELYLEYSEYKKNDNYCYDKWVETFMRRNTTRVEDKLCSKQLTKYTSDYMVWKRSVVRY